MVSEIRLNILQSAKIAFIRQMGSTVVLKVLETTQRFTYLFDVDG